MALLDWAERVRSWSKDRRSRVAVRVSFSSSFTLVLEPLSSLSRARMNSMGLEPESLPSTVYYQHNSPSPLTETFSRTSFTLL